MHCSEYISEYLAAHADNELTPHQRRDADQHAGECTTCRRRLANERALKELIRQHASLTKAPAELRLRIRAALHETVFPASSANTLSVGTRTSSHDRDGTGAQRSGSWRAAGERLRQPQVWVPVGIAGSLILVLALLTGRAIQPVAMIASRPIPAFDVAISKYREFQREFIPNVPPEAFTSRDGTLYAWVVDRNPIQRVAANDDSDDISRSYREMNMPDDLLDFSAAGYQIVGGRFDHLPDRHLITYTLYGGNAGQILSLCFSDPTMSAPIGAVDWLGMRSFYTYKGYSICLSFYPAGHFVSILVSRMPLPQLLRYVASADTTTISEK